MHVNQPVYNIDAYGGLGLSLNQSLFPLDSYLSKGLIHAYSVSRKLTSVATNAFRVRRSSDNAEQDIGFSGNEVNTTSLLTFIGANDGFIVTIYDQVGSSDATLILTTNQLRVVVSGSLEVLNGVFTNNAVGASSSPYTLSSSYNVSGFTSFFVYSQPAIGIFVDSIRSGSDVVNLARIDTLRFRLNNVTYDSSILPIVINTFHSCCVRYNFSSGNTEFWYDNNSVGSQTAASSGVFTVDSLYQWEAANTKIPEIIIFDVVITDLDRDDINSNIDNFYGI